MRDVRKVRLTVLPNVNLVSNIGFKSEALHTKVKNEIAEMDTEAMKYPISHPDYMLRDSVADSTTENKMCSGHPLISRAINKVTSSLFRMSKA